VIQFNRGSKHAHYCKLALKTCVENTDVIGLILQLLVTMTNSSQTSSWARVSNWSAVHSELEDDLRRDGPLEQALFNGPFMLYFDHNEDLLVSDAHSIRLIDMNTMQVGTLCGGNLSGYADGTGQDATISLPVYIAQNEKGEYMVLESHAHQIRKIVMNDGVDKEGRRGLDCVVTTVFSKDGDLLDLSYPHWIGYDDKLRLLCSDTVHNDLAEIDVKEKRKFQRKTILTPETMEWVDEDGSIQMHHSKPTAQFNYPAVACYNAKRELILCDYHNHRILKLCFQADPLTTNKPTIRVHTLAGSPIQGFADGVGSQARFCNPNGVSLDVDDYVIVSDAGNGAIRRISPSGAVTTIAGGLYKVGDQNGRGCDSGFNTPTNIALDKRGNILVADWKNRRIRKIVF